MFTLYPSFSNAQDTTKVDKISKIDTVNVLKISGSALKDEVVYAAKDSVVYRVEDKKIYLYGDAEIKYQNINLKSYLIVIDYAKNEAVAEGKLDSSNNLVQTPIFVEQGKEYKSDKMVYNFKTSKGKVYVLKTKEGEGHIKVEEGKYVKKDTVNIIYAKNARYSTCDDPHPHYYIEAGKMKIIPQDKIISGPAVMHIGDVPMPLVIPFGFFPAKNNKRASGLLFPQYGNDKFLGGFFLRDLGYYFGLSDYYDLKLTTDVYTNGSYAFRANSNYAYKYHYNGSFTGAYARMITGLEDTKERSASTQYQINWQHVIDPRALTNANFSANVNISSSKYQRFNERDLNNRLNNNLSSSVMYSKTFVGTPFSFNSSLRHSQNQNGQVTLNLPDMAFNMARIYPLKSVFKNNKNQFINNFGLNYGFNVKNDITTSDSMLFANETWNNPRTFKNGGVHNLGIMTSGIVLKHFSLNPSIRYRNLMYINRMNASYLQDTDILIVDTVKGFYMAQDYSMGTDLSTNIFGTIPINKGRMVALRHLITPSVGYSYTPDLKQNSNNFQRFEKSDGSEFYFNRFNHGVFGGVNGANTTNMLNFSVNNQLELKRKIKADTLGKTEKIKILDNLTLRSSYNLDADSFNLSLINISGFTSIFGKLNLNFNGIIDPYKYQNGKAINEIRLQSLGNGVGRLTSGSVALSTTLNPQASDKEKRNYGNDPRYRYFFPGTYTDETIKWNAATSINISFISIYKENTKRFKDTLSTANFQLNGSFQVTKTWKFDYQFSYDLIRKQISSPNIVIAKDLHCWEMRFNWTPFGAFQQYWFNINIKSSTLKDLKWDRRKSFNSYN